MPTFISRLHAAVALSAAVLAATVAPAHAQQYPSKPITIVVPFGAGSGTDQQARSMAQALGTEYKVPVIVDNRAGASTWPRPRPTATPCS